MDTTVTSPAQAPTSRIALLREQRYRRQFLQEDARQLAIVLVVASAAYALTVPNDFSQLGGAILGISVASRGLFLVSTGIAIALLRRARWPRQHDRAARFGLGALVLFGSVIHLSKLSTGRVQGPLIACLALLCLLYFALRGPVLPRALAGAAFTLGGVALVALAGPGALLDTQGRLATAIVLGSVNLAGLFSARAFDQQRRKRFEAEQREQRAHQELAARLVELAAAKERAEAASRARGAFLAAMSHEFRTPMNAVIGLSDLVLEAPLGIENRAHVQAINDSARALLRLLEDILDFAKIDAQKLSLSEAPFDLRRLAASVADLLRPAARDRGIELALEIAPEVPAHVIGDDARLRQVLVNLASNAVKFTERGAVRLRIAAAPGPAIDFRVEDSGIGIPAEVLPRLFQPFAQADTSSARRHGGTGLGLAISKQIVAAMGGELLAWSEPGRGSVFIFSLPLAPAPAAAAAAAPAPAPARAADRPPLVILVVDDHPLNREVARAKLARLGYRVDLADDGRRALEAIARTDYDVVFMDLQMPGMSGIEATARIGERLAADGRRRPHVIAMTASLFEEDRAACRRAGMADFVGKPLDLAQLDAALARVAEARGAAVPPVAAEAIAELRRVEDLGEPRFFEGLCRLFLDDAPRRVGRMRAALARGDAAALAREAHTLKAAGATLGARALAGTCARLEAAARGGALEAHRPELDTLDRQLAEVSLALAAELGDGGPPAAEEAS